MMAAAAAAAGLAPRQPVLCICQRGTLPCLQPCGEYCEGGGRRYRSRNGFSEMLLFEGLKTLRLRLDNPPQRLYLAEGFSKLTELSTVELHMYDKDFRTSLMPTFSASS